MSKTDAKFAAIDFDGTLLHNVVVSHACFCMLLAKEGIPPISLETYQQCVDMKNKTKFMRKAGFSVWKLLALQCSPSRRKEMTAFYNRQYALRARDIVLREGVQEGLAALREQGVACFIWSNAGRHVIDFQAKRLEIADHFSEILCSGEGRVGPKGRWLKRYITKHNISPRNLVLIGDTYEEPTTALDLGATSIVLTGGYSTPQRLAASKPHHIVDSWHEIPAKVKAHFANGGPR